MPPAEILVAFARIGMRKIVFFLAMLIGAIFVIVPLMPVTPGLVVITLTLSLSIAVTVEHFAGRRGYNQACFAI